MIYPEGMKILYDAECKNQGGNFFVIGCLPQGLGLDEELCPHLENAPSSFLMFGGLIWHNVELQLDRCCKLNRSRLKKLTDKTEGLFWVKIYQNWFQSGVYTITFTVHGWCIFNLQGTGICILLLFVTIIEGSTDTECFGCNQLKGRSTHNYRPWTWRESIVRGSRTR